MDYASLRYGPCTRHLGLRDPVPPPPRAISLLRNGAACCLVLTLDGFVRPGRKSGPSPRSCAEVLSVPCSHVPRVSRCYSCHSSLCTVVGQRTGPHGRKRSVEDVPASPQTGVSLVRRAAPFLIPSRSPALLLPGRGVWEGGCYTRVQCPPLRCSHLSIWLTVVPVFRMDMLSQKSSFCFPREAAVST